MSGPRVVAIGGGHGLAATLRACAPLASDLTAVVSVADDGGSSGRLRADVDLPAPGDLRRCLTALAAPERATLAAALERRFEGGELDGHAPGNLLLAALAAETGDFVAALAEVATILGVTATVLPATTAPVDLVATRRDGTDLRGQVAVQAATDIDRVALDPPDAPAPVAVPEALARADLVVLGPGSLYTSVLAACAVTAVREAVADSGGRRVFVCNLGPQAGETAGYDVGDHVAALRRHGVEPDIVLAHSGAMPAGDLGDAKVDVVEADVARPNGRAHDPERLGAALMALL